MCMSPVTQILASKPFNHIPVKSWQTSSAMKPQNLLQDGTMARWKSWLRGSHTSQQAGCSVWSSGHLSCFAFRLFLCLRPSKPSPSEGETQTLKMFWVWHFSSRLPPPRHECSMMGRTRFQGTPLKVPSMSLSNQCYLFIVCGQCSRKSPWFGL